uniref:Ig-like domain-containing protein n=1 Tax=Photinus pyralis TaxID=7054 RepID=A0A1Y1KWP0_PHOPY
MPFNFGDETMNDGDTVSAQCTVTKGDLPITILWYLNGKPVNEYGSVFTSYMGKRINNLAIDSVQANHVGSYTCSATNLAGSTNFSTYLNINGTFFYRHVCP